MNLIRVDDRLIHGQVAVGWGSYIKPVYMIISDDEIAGNETDTELYLLGVPFEYKGKVLSISETVRFVESIKNESFILVLKTMNDALKLFAAGYKFQRLNLGGLHLTEGKREINHYIYLDESDLNIIKKLNELGVEIFVQDLPTNSKFGIDQILNKWKKQ